jgi:hypothetical protein
MIFYPLFYPFIPTTNEKPVTIYSILNSYLNYQNPDPVKITNLAKQGRGVIFDFDYPLSNAISKEEFETQILNHYMMRRIGFETVTAFKIALSSKLFEIMPIYNKLFDSLQNWNILNDGEVVHRTYDSDSTNSSTADSSGESNSSSDRRYSETPQGNLEDVRDGSYVSEYNYDTDINSTSSNTSSSGTNNINDVENITRSPADKIYIYKEFLNSRNSIMKSIYNELDNLFYGIIS